MGMLEVHRKNSKFTVLRKKGYGAKTFVTTKVAAEAFTTANSGDKASRDPYTPARATY